ncbi:alpha/beta hydrolase [Marinobacter mobilis]|uniref:Lysophospholipase, alpha-beta hydrolase superfamily n=1 Tax=Marinobacter mobilis TaxID=488533 RepID=A0A1H2Q8I1_9GAMM|nr:alpha/beta hydrolase [Marinobacter mobilis]SDW03270.1 Lysophospholipase, alpha-beta hydrolase superfamily [Marinobacter mobilis]
MTYTEHFLDAADGHRIPVKVWHSDRPLAVLVISHGMAEHASRYGALASWLNEHGIEVFALEHRGHGPFCEKQERGHYSDQNGWQKVVDDLHAVIRFGHQQHPDLPLTLFGHSMGSFIAQACAQQYGDDLDNLILCATNRIDHPHLRASQLLIRTIARFRGGRYRSKLIDRMTFGAFNKQFRPNRTSHDWLSRDTEQVDRYLADPLCGTPCTVQLWSDFIGGMLAISPRQWRKDLPVHLMAGSDDPVGEMGSGVSRHCDAIHQAGITLASFRLFPGARHELVNETNADEVWQHLLDCLPQDVPGISPGVSQQS